MDDMIPAPTLDTRTGAGLERSRRVEVFTGTAGRRRSTALRRLSPKAEVAEAIAYGRKCWTALTRFLDDGRLEIGNNIAERAMRSIAISQELAVRHLQADG